MRAYLNDLEARIGALPGEQRLYLKMLIDPESREGRRPGDVENYLSPVVLHLGWRRFVYVLGQRVNEAGSQLEIGIIKDVSNCPADDGWVHFSHQASNMTGWKRSLRSALEASGVQPSLEGELEVHAAWRCSDQRNWVEPLWKETIDAMGPVLGAANPDRPYDVNDDRISTLELHRHIDNSIGWGVQVDLWWRSLATIRRGTGLEGESGGK